MTQPPSSPPALDSDSTSSARIRRVGVIGGGTAGYFAALALKARLPDLDVTLVESSAIPIIGVGEATTTLMPPFLHTQLGIDILDFYEQVRPTWKLGIRFDWGAPGDGFFTYPFGDADTVESHVYENDLQLQSLTSMMMATDRSPILTDAAGEPESLLPRMKFAYHLDNKRFVAFLARRALQVGIHHIDARIDRVVLSPSRDRVESLHTDDGRDLRFDLFVDASGFRSLLIGDTLGSPFIDYQSSLFCDRAIVADVPQEGVIAPYTLAQTMDAGWCWKIAVEGMDHRGYVHSSAFLDEEQAVAEMRAKNPTMGPHRVVRFRSGRHRDFWLGNTVAIGNAYGFVEPLESTALHMVIVEIEYLLACLESAGDGPPDTGFANESVGSHWDYLRWFLAVHYKFNRKSDTPFWRACRDTVDVSGLADAIERFQKFGPWLGAAASDHKVGDPAFGYSGLMILLLGQGVAGPPGQPRKSPTDWAEHLKQRRSQLARALPQAEALELLRRRPDLLREFATAPDSWCRRDVERIVVSPADRSIARPKQG